MYHLTQESSMYCQLSKSHSLSMSVVQGYRTKCTTAYPHCGGTHKQQRVIGHVLFLKLKLITLQPLTIFKLLLPIHLLHAVMFTILAIHVNIELLFNLVVTTTCFLFCQSPGRPHMTSSKSIIGREGEYPTPV